MNKFYPYQIVSVSRYLSNEAWISSRVPFSLNASMARAASEVYNSGHSVSIFDCSGFIPWAVHAALPVSLDYPILWQSARQREACEGAAIEHCQKEFLRGACLR